MIIKQLWNISLFHGKANFFSFAVFDISNLKLRLEKQIKLQH